MRRVLVVVGLTALLASTAGPALAAPDPLPTLPQDCHEWNALLHIQNVRSCDPPPAE